MSDVDFVEIRRLAMEARDGDASATPPIEPTREAPEIGRRIARALAAASKDPKADDEERQRAHINLVGLATQGAVPLAKRLLQENDIKITRRGETVAIRGGYSLPHSVATNGQGKATSVAADDQMARPSSLYVQFDFMTWHQLRTLRDQIQARHRGLGALVVTIDEILTLETAYPSCLVGEAMVRAGLDRETFRMNLDDGAQPAAANDA